LKLVAVLFESGGWHRALAAHDFSFPNAESKPNREETAGEKAGERRLHAVVMEESQHAINTPRRSQHEPD
jgi:hypothetical protein